MSGSAPSASVEQDQAALERICTRVSLAKDEDLEALVGKLLGPALLKLTLDNAALQKHVLQLLSLLQTRIRAAPSLKLPATAMLTTFKQAAPQEVYVKNMALKFLRTAVDRMDALERTALVVPLLEGCSSYANASHSTAIFQMAMWCIASCSAAGVTTPDIALGPSDRAAFLSAARKLLLYVPGADSHPPPRATPRQRGLLRLQEQQRAQVPILNARPRELVGSVPGSDVMPAQEEGATFAMPGLTVADVEAMAGAEERGGLEAQKLGLLRVLGASGSLEAAHVLLPLEAAACDPSEKVSSEAEHLLRRKCGITNNTPAVDLEDTALMTDVFELLLGSTEVGQARRPACGNALQIRLYRLLCRSAAACSLMPDALLAITSALRSYTMPKKQAGMEFTQWVLRHADDASMKRLAPQLFDLAVVMLAGMSPGDAGPAMKMRTFLYQAIGSLAQRTPEVFKHRVEVAERLFEAVGSEVEGARVTVQEAVNRIAAAYKGAGPSAAPALRQMLKRAARSANHSCRLCAVNWAAEVFEPTDEFARQLCIAAASDAKAEVAAAARRALGLPAHSSSSPVSPRTASGTAPRPPFPTMLAALRAQHPPLKFAPGSQPSVPPASLMAALEFLDGCPEAQGQDAGKATAGPRSHPVQLESEDGAEQDAGASPMEVDGEAGSDGPEAAEVASPQVSPEEAAACRDQLADGYLVLLDHALVKSMPTELHERALRTLLSLCRRDRPRIAHRAELSREHLTALLESLSPAVRDLAARLCGLVASVLPESAFQQQVEAIVAKDFPPSPAKDASGPAAAAAAKGGDGVVPNGAPPKFERQHGAVLAAGYMVGLRLCEGAGGGQAARSLAVRLLGLSRCGNAQLEGAVAASFGRLLLSGSDVGVPEGAEGDGGDAGADAAAAPMTLRAWVACVRKLAKEARHVKSARARIHLLHALGFVAVGTSISHPEVQLQCVQALAEPPLADETDDTLLAAADAAALVFRGAPASPADLLLHEDASNWVSVLVCPPATSTTGGLSDPPDATMDTSVSAAAAELTAVQTAVVDAALGRVDSSSAKAREAAALWLLRLCQVGRPVGSLQVALPRVHAALLRLLGDAREPTQEAASCGLTAAYDAASESIRPELMKTLLATLQALSTPTFRAQHLEASQAAGAAPAAAQPALLYREICALATSLGQPPLVYRLFELVNSGVAGIRSRRLSLGGLGTGSTDIVEALKPRIRELLPKLYRNTYDPNGRVQESMSGLLVALAPQRAAALDEHFSTVLKALLSDLSSRMWRYRQAACLATADLLQSRKWAQLQPHFEALWESTLRVADDVNQAVQENAERLLRTLSSVTIRLADVARTPKQDSEEALAIALNILLHKALPSPVAAVKAQSLETVSAVIDAAAPAQIAPQLPQLIEVLLQSLSSFESGAWNQLQMHATRLGVDTAGLEAKRVALSSQTPMQSALTRCVRLVDESSLVAVTGVLKGLLKGGVGLTTRTGTAGFVVSLQSQLPTKTMQKPAGELLPALLAGASADASDALRRAYASAAGVLAKCASAKRLEWLVGQICEMYSSPDGAARKLSGTFMNQVLHQAADHVHTSPILPLALRARFDADAGVAAIWTDVWTELGRSESAVLVTHGHEVVDAAIAELRADDWARRRGAAQVLQRLAASCGGALEPHAPRVAAVLLEQVGGRTWTGKEEMARALGALVEHCPAAFASRAGDAAAQPEAVTGEAVVRALLQECEKRSGEFAEAAVEALQVVLKALKGQDHMALLLPMVSAAVEAGQKEASADKQADGKQGMAKDTQGSVKPKECLKVVAAACGHASPASLTASWPTLQPLLLLGLQRGCHWSTHLSALQCSKAILDKLGGGGPPSAEVVAGATGLGREALHTLEDARAQVRLASLRFVECVLGVHGVGSDAAGGEQLAGKLQALARSEPDPGVRTLATSLLARLAERAPGSQSEPMET